MEFFTQVAQFVHAPSFLVLASIIRIVVALHYRSSVQSSVALDFFCTYGVHVLTVVIWQCYFANSLASIQGFLRYWEFSTSRQRILSLSLGVPAILCAPFFVTSGLLELTHGSPPTVPIRVLSFLPALLWTIPVILNSAIGLSQAANGAQLKQMQEVFTVHLVSLPLYYMFLKNSEGDSLVGSSVSTTVTMLGVALIGFVLQFMYMGPHRPHGRCNEDIEQGQLGADHFGELQASSIVEHQVSTEHEPVTSPPYDSPRVSHIYTGKAPLLQYWRVKELFVQVIQFINAPKLLMLASIIRTVVAVCFSGELGSILNFLRSCSILVLTAVIWQCYFANSLASIKDFFHYWAFFTSRRQILSLAWGLPAVLCAPFFVGSGLLELTHGLPPSVPMCVLSFLPALLWTIPVILNSTIGLSQAANGAQLKQMQEVFTVHLVSLTLYCVFLMNSEGDTLVGSSGTTILSMLGVALIGFVLQYMYMGSHKLDGRFNGDIEQERLVVNHFREPEATGVMELEEQSTLPSEMVLSPLATHHVSTEHELVTSPPYNPPRLSHREELVIHVDRLVLLRRTPDAVCRCPAHVHNNIQATTP